ncbi:MAG: sigma-70 family RNA polymerase sigma factor [Lentisphaerae bacterium]|nr:sigma-70 family RNA polymerase sigma factor [Lentisphaerota bacterium]
MLDTSNAYERYVAEIARYPRISSQREAELSRIIRGGRNRRRVEAAVEELVHANLRLVLYCLRSFDSYLRSPDVRVSHMDLVGEGNLALLRAARNFDSGYSRGEPAGGGRHAPFGRYACKCIRLAMLRAVKLSRLIRVPEYHFKYWGRMRALRREHGADLTDELMERELHVNTEVLCMLRRSETTATLMLEDLGREDSESSWEEWMPDNSLASPAQETERKDMRRFLNEEMDRLPARTRRILQLLFMSDSRPTLAELAGLFGISAERCRQVCGQGLERLRAQLEGRLQRVDPSLIPAAPSAAAVSGAEAAA